MTSFLRINGIAVPVAIDAANLAPESIGKNRRSGNGLMSASRRLRKGGWKFNTALKTAAEALAFRELICGEGHVLSFDSSFYTSQGMAPVSIGSGWTRTTSSPAPAFGAACAKLASGGAASTWAFFSSSSPWTVAWWVYHTATVGPRAGQTRWHWYLQDSTGNVWADGVQQAPATTLPLLTSVTAGVATFTPTGSDTWLDDVTALAYVVPSSWPLQMFNWGDVTGQPFSNLPALVADGLLIEQNTRVAVLGGDTPAARVVATQTAKNFHDFSFELAEI